MKLYNQPCWSRYDFRRRKGTELISFYRPLWTFHLREIFSYRRCTTWAQHGTPSLEVPLNLIYIRVSFENKKFQISVHFIFDELLNDDPPEPPPKTLLNHNKTFRLELPIECQHVHLLLHLQLVLHILILLKQSTLSYLEYLSKSRLRFLRSSSCPALIRCCKAFSSF
jgi:hypothetical protein